ncbi:MAG: hypothetical protein CL886_04995 [Dehalococcoidia bacterium]|nr:hypothetical protein [Dehalococcoidia bacterium]|tara:strand:- start:8594 stop:8833 length:240 start_codon:yes stop_codon:yes gene_type:complete
MDITEINTLIIKTRTAMSDLINKWERFMVSRKADSHRVLDPLNVLSPSLPGVIARSTRRINDPSLTLAEAEILGRINLS